MHLIILKSFLSVTAHTGDTVKNDGVSFFYLSYELVPLRSALSGAGIELSDYSSLWIKLGDIGNLSCYSLVLSTYSAISVCCHNSLLCSIESNYSYFLCYYFIVSLAICKPFLSKISTLFAKLSFDTEKSKHIHFTVFYNERGVGSLYNKIQCPL